MIILAEERSKELILGNILTLLFSKLKVNVALEINYCYDFLINGSKLEFNIRCKKSINSNQCLIKRKVKGLKVKIFHQRESSIKECQLKLMDVYSNV